MTEDATPNDQLAAIQRQIMWNRLIAVTEQFVARMERSEIRGQRFNVVCFEKGIPDCGRRAPSIRATGPGQIRPRHT